jgi:alcohol dehydrogenase YqhD (iron-dependent ADH family)
MDRVLSNETAPKFAEYGINVWGLSPSEDVMSVAKQAIQCTRDFFKQMNLPTTLREVGIDDSQLEAMVDHVAPRCASSSVYVPLSREDVLGIFRAAL